MSPRGVPVPLTAWRRRSTTRPRTDAAISANVGIGLAIQAADLRMAEEMLHLEPETLRDRRLSRQARVGILKHLMQTENGADAPQAPMPRRVVGEEVPRACCTPR